MEKWEVKDFIVMTTAVQYLFSHTLEGSPQLTKLIFLDNQLKSIHCRAFEHLTELQELEISGNPLDHLFLGTFSNNFTSDTFHNVSQLTELHLEGNMITKLDDGIFAVLTELLTELSSLSNIFRNVTALMILDLSENQITSLPETIFNDLSEIRTIYLLHGNPWKCDCHIWYLHDWVLENSKTMEMLDRVVCESPNFLKKRAVMSINKDQLVCHLSRDEMPDLSTCSLQASNGIMIIKCKFIFPDLFYEFNADKSCFQVLIKNLLSLAVVHVMWISQIAGHCLCCRPHQFLSVQFRFICIASNHNSSHLKTTR
uniref:LRRCT domain-containing protein n=1 Tax=Pundamilia nyererei TaxID=303518 RepID=A0A3B4ERP2_9CICH